MAKSIIAMLSVVLASIKVKVALYKQHRRVIEELESYSDHDLESIGMSRAGIISAVKYDNHVSTM